MVYLVLFVVLTSISQILLKKESLKISYLRSGSYFKRMILNPVVLSAYFLSLCNVFIWIMALTNNSLLNAFLFTSSIYILMVLIDAIFFKEKLNVFKLIGAGLISMGIILSLQ